MRKLTVAHRQADPYRLHDVPMALSRARAAATLLKVCGAGDSYLQMPETLSPGEEREQRAWFQAFAEEALERALADADAGFRRTLTPEQARAQIVGGA